MQRITPGQVLSAFAATGIKPARTGGQWFDDDGCGCAAAALIRLREPGFSNPHWPVAMAAACLGVSRDYLAGFVLGFDGLPVLHPNGTKQEGHADGLAAAEAVFCIADEGDAP